MMHTKMPAVAGIFYPENAAALRASLQDLMRQPGTGSGLRPHALIAPHAGYPYSGPIAAHAYARLIPWAAEIHRVIVLAPAHRLAFHGVAISSADAFRTPLGDIAVDREVVAALERIAGVQPLDAAFASEHALEVQLPFLQTVLDDFRLVPLIVGDAAADTVSQVIEAAWRADALIVVSSDLSHFHAYHDGQQRDRRTSQAIEQLQGDRIGPDDACGAYPIRGLLKTAQRRGWSVRTLDLRNSGDTAGDRSRVVGYGAYEFC